MQIKVHETDNVRIAEIISDQLVMETTQEALDLMMTLADQGFIKMIVHADKLPPRFFQLSSGLAGEILQKVVNYRLQLAIVGDFENVPSESLRAFIRESNRGRVQFFVPDVAAAVARLSTTDL